MPAVPLAFAFLLLCLHQASRVLASASLDFYEDAACAIALALTVEANATGICTDTDATQSFGSFKLISVDSGCAVTAYADNNTYCGDGYKFVVQLDVCVPASNLDINQFTEDCTDAPASSASYTASASGATPPSSAPSSSTSVLKSSTPISSTSTSDSTTRISTPTSPSSQPSETSNTSSSSNSNSNAGPNRIALGVGLGVGLAALFLGLPGACVAILQLKRRARMHSPYVP